MTLQDSFTCFIKIIFSCCFAIFISTKLNLKYNRRKHNEIKQKSCLNYISKYWGKCHKNWFAMLQYFRSRKIFLTKGYNSYKADTVIT